MEELAHGSEGIACLAKISFLSITVVDVEGNDLDLFWSAWDGCLV
jgi:hypothetical protein